MEQFIKFIKGAAPLAYFVIVAICCIANFGRGGFLTTMGIIGLATTAAIVIAYMLGHPFQNKEK